MGKYIKLSLVVIVTFLIDRALKLFFQKNPYEIFYGDFFNGMLSFHFESNAGIAFGIPINPWLLLGLIFFIMMFLFNVIISEYKKDNLLVVFSLGLIVTGALSNLIDRIRFGYVVDYIDLTFFTVFNLADAAITIGVLVFAVAALREKGLDKKASLS